MFPLRVTGPAPRLNPFPCGTEDEKLPFTTMGMLLCVTEVEEQATAPLIGYYSKKGLVRPIKGVGGIDDIFKQIVGIVSAGTGCSCGCKH